MATGRPEPYYKCVVEQVGSLVGDKIKRRMVVLRQCVLEGYVHTVGF